MDEGREPVQTPKPGALFGRYRVRRELGAGGMGVVYEAEHVDLGKRVALKTLRARFVGELDVVERFVREGRAAARVRHPHVVDVTDVGAVRGVPYLVMEYLDGETLAARLARGPMEPAELASLMLPVCAAVAAAHAQGVLHRDLKPDNVFLERAPRGETSPKVLDFGIAKVLDDDAPSLTQTAAPLGTPFYMSPEQTRGARDVDARSDQYALGVILYEGVTGQRPFTGETFLAVAAAIATGEAPSPRSLRPDLPAAFEAAVLRAMARDPDRRFDSVRALGAALLPFADARARLRWEGAFHASSDPPPEPRPRAREAAPALAETVGGARAHVGERLAPRASSRRGWAAWALALAVAALVSAAGYRLTRAPPPVARARADAGAASPRRQPLPAVTAVMTDDVPSASGAAAARARPAPARSTRGIQRPSPGRAPPASGRREIPME